MSSIAITVLCRDSQPYYDLILSFNTIDNSAYAHVYQHLKSTLFVSDNNLS